MNNYMILFTYTQNGLSNLKDSPQRMKNAGLSVKDFGIELIGAYYTPNGSFDTVFLVKGTEESVVKFALSIAGNGNVNAKVIRLFDLADFQQLLT